MSASSKLFREAIASDNWQPLTRVVVILEGSVYRAQVILLVVDLYVVLYDIISYNIPPCACSVAGKHRCVAQEDRTVVAVSTQAALPWCGAKPVWKHCPLSTQWKQYRTEGTVFVLTSSRTGRRSYPTRVSREKRLSLDGYPWNLVLDGLFMKMVSRKQQIWRNLTKYREYFMKICSYFTVSGCINSPQKYFSLCAAVSIFYANI